MKQFIVDADLLFYEEESTLPGVKKVADYVRKDIELITGALPQTYYEGTAKNIIIYGTVGHSTILAGLASEGHINLAEIEGKREVYSVKLLNHPAKGIENALIIAGSDKRGTIYGLFHLSELLGVSPLVNWNHVWPKKQKQIILSETIEGVSKEPSVKYRGFFINDEWPAFGNWAKTHFGDANALCYEKVFELLLRLKGNYLWPAMWNSNFNLDGPGLKSAELADELGVVMSTSHHEPCMRSGAEYGLVRGKDSIYKDAWDFIANPDGITQFWRDGLIRNREFENVITMGMRGENDTAIMEKATLAENIQLLKNVLVCQNQLIKETINEDLDKVPRQIVLFTEVEEFFYGNAQVPGLINDPELDGITLMLSDNNVGATRTLPTEKMRSHKGGYGMYYHMDMHGGPYSFQWIGSTYLPKVWEQMTCAYEYGVQEIWVTNIGDIGTQEMGLSFFLDLAYDIDKWGGQDANITKQYLTEWTKKNLGNLFTEAEQADVNKILWAYTELLAKRKHEIMNDTIYHPVHFGEADDILEISQNILDTCKQLHDSCKPENMAAYLSLVHYPACGTANLMKMWILTGKNHLYAKQNRISANLLAEEINKCFMTDYELTDEYHAVDDGFFYGFGLSEHIGFTNWNDEDNKYPIRHYVHPANESRMIVSRVNDTRYMTGLAWTSAPQTWLDGLRPDVGFIEFDIACASHKPVEYRIDSDCPFISFSSTEGVVTVSERIRLKIHRELITGHAIGHFTITHIGYGVAKVTVEACNRPDNLPPCTFLETDNYIAINAEHYKEKKDMAKGAFHTLTPYGRTGSAIKVYPVTADFYEENERPYVMYEFMAQQDGEYNIEFFLSATTPVVYERIHYIGYSINLEQPTLLNTVKQPERQFFQSAQWSHEAHDNIKKAEAVVKCKKGINKLYFYGVSPTIILERIVLHPVNTKLLPSYLGPKESYFYE